MDGMDGMRGRGYMYDRGGMCGMDGMDCIDGIEEMC